VPYHPTKRHLVYKNPFKSITCLTLCCAQIIEQKQTFPSNAILPETLDPACLILDIGFCHDAYGRTKQQYFPDGNIAKTYQSGILHSRGIYQSGVPDSQVSQPEKLHDLLFTSVGHGCGFYAH
jgi:hypothetical protein